MQKELKSAVVLMYALCQLLSCIVLQVLNLFMALSSDVNEYISGVGE